MVDLDGMRKWRLTAVTWTKKTVARLRVNGEEARNEGERWLVGYEAEQLICRVVSEVDMLVPLLGPDQIEEAERDAKELLRRLRNHRLAFDLEKTGGRTEAEAALFAAKAAELRS